MRSIAKLSVLAISMAVLGGQALAEPNHGVLCNPQGANAAAVSYNQWGANNTSTLTPATVHCGGGKNFSSPSTITAMVHDRHNVEDVCCTFRVTDAAGGLFGSARRCSTGFASSPMPLTAGVVPNAGYVDVECSIPRYHTSNGASAITTYEIR